MLSTLAGFALAGTPATLPPDAQMMASAMSEVKPPHLPSTRAGTTFALNAMPGPGEGVRASPFCASGRTGAAPAV